MNLNSRAVCTPDSTGSSSWYWDEAEVLLVVLLPLPTSSGKEEAAEEQRFAIKMVIQHFWKFALKLLMGPFFFFLLLISKQVTLG